ncbi:MAG: peptidoglycan DD-metalloendopeptidase family protein [Pseudomonadota bacterium]
MMTPRTHFAALAAALVLTGCVALGPTSSPAPVGEGQAPTRIEAPIAAQPAAPGGKFYTVKKGDTLYSIAREHGVAPRDLQAWNNIENPGRIATGQQLRVSPLASGAPVERAATDTEVRPVAGAGQVEARPLDGGAPAGSPAPASPENTEKLKRAPRGGKLPYSEENLALLKAREATPVATTTVASQPAVQTVTPEPAPAPAQPAPAVALDWDWPASGKLIATYSDAGAGQEMSKGIDIAGRIGDPVQAAAAGKVIYVGAFPKHGNLTVLLHGDGYSSVYAHNSRILVKEGQQVRRGQKIAEIGDSDADQPKLHFEVRQQGKPVDPLRFLPPRK